MTTKMMAAAGGRTWEGREGAFPRDPTNWLVEYRQGNDALAAIHGEPSTASKDLEEARRHLRYCDKRRDLEGRLTELHVAVSSLLKVIEQEVGR